MVISIPVPIASFMKSAQKSDGGLSDVRKLLLRPIVILWPWGGDSPGATRAVVGPVNSATGHRLLSNLSWKMCCCSPVIEHLCLKYSSCSFVLGLSFNHKSWWTGHRRIPTVSRVWRFWRYYILTTPKKFVKTAYVRNLIFLMSSDRKSNKCVV